MGRAVQVERQARWRRRSLGMAAARDAAWAPAHAGAHAGRGAPARRGSAGRTSSGRWPVSSPALRVATSPRRVAARRRRDRRLALFESWSRGCSRSPEGGEGRPGRIGTAWGFGNAFSASHCLLSATLNRHLWLQGQLPLKHYADKDFGQEVVAPTACATLHRDAVLARMLF